MRTLQRHHVPSGSYFVGPHRPIILQAFLGTCVGVAVFDRKAGAELERLNTHGLTDRLNAIGLSAERFQEIVAIIPDGALNYETDTHTN